MNQANRVTDIVDEQILLDGLNYYTDEQLKVLPMEAAKNISAASTKNDEAIIRLNFLTNQNANQQENEQEADNAYLDELIKRQQQSLPQVNTTTNNNNNTGVTRTAYGSLYSDILKY